MLHRGKNQLIKAIFRSNKGFTAAFAVFYILQAALTMWMLMLPSSVRGTIEKFADEYNMKCSPFVRQCGIIKIYRF